MTQNLPSQKIHTTEITAVTVSQDVKFITSFSKLDEVVALWNYPTGSNNPVTLELNHLKKNKKIDIKMIIDTKNKITCEFDLTMSKKLSYNRLFIILYSSERDKPMILDEEMEYITPDCLKDVFGRAEFLADEETLGIYDNKTIHVISIKTWPWILLRRIYIQNNEFQVFTLSPSTNKNYVIFRQWEPHNVFDVIDIDTCKCYLRIMPTPGETMYTISNMCISSAGDLLAYKTSLGGLHVYDLSSGLAVMSKKLIFPCDFQFVNGGKNLLIINFDKEKEHILATLYSARSGTELAHVALSQRNTKNVRIINDEQVLVVLSNLNRNILVVDEWNWVNMFRKLPIQYTDVFTSNYKDDRDLITGFKVGKYPNFSPSVKLVRDFPDVNVPPGKLVLDDSCSEYVISSRSLQIRFASGVKLFCIDEQNIILISSRMIILFCAIDNDKINLQKLVWRLPHYLPDINKFSYRCINDFSHKRILWIDITCGNNSMYTIIPLDVAISGHDLPDEWMQHSCECQGPIKFLNLLSIKSYTHCNTFNSAKTICDLIRYKVTQYDEYTPTEILEEILQHNYYIPTVGSNGENPLTIAILEFKSVEIQQLLDYCIYHCIHDGQPGFMSIVVDALPELARHYPKILDKLMKQCTYVKIPSIIWKLKPEKYDSIHENLWGYKFDGSVFMTSSKNNFLNTLFDKWETIPRHSATYCFVPLPGLCTYPEMNYPCHWLAIFLNTLIPRHPSTFVKLVRLRPFEAFKSPPFEAIVKFKWHAFARWRFFQLLFLYLIHFGLFVSAVVTNRRQLMIASMILGAILILTWIRRSIIHYVNGIRFFTVFATYIELAAFILPVITGFLKHGDNVTHPELQSLSVLSLWIFVAAQLRVFKDIGVIIAVVAHISRKILWFLLLLAFILLAFANSWMFLLSEDSKDSNTFTSFGSSLKNVWSMVLCDYESLKPWTDNRLVNTYKVVFSFSTTIILMNILIAMLSNTYEETINYARTVWVIKRAEIIIDIELSWMIPSERQNRNYFPWSIIYEAFTEEVDEWSKKFEVKDVIAKIKDEIDEMKDEMIELKNVLKQFQKFPKVVEQEIK